MSGKHADTLGDTYRLKVAGVVLPAEDRGGVEKTAGDMAAKIESIDHLDPLDAEPAVIFNPAP